MADNAHPRNEQPEFPHYDWVFRCDLALGGITPGHRTTRHNGHTVEYQATTDIRTGARWCSRAWLRRTDTGVRGPAMHRQTGVSRMGMRVKGIVTGGVIVVVPDTQVELAARIAAYLVTPYAHGAYAGDDDAERDNGVGAGIDEWSMALVREPHRTRIAVALDCITPAVRRHLRNELDVEWFVIFGERRTGGRPHTHDNFRIETPDGAESTWRLGSIHHDNETVPDRLVDAARAAQGRGRPGRDADPSPALLVENTSHRPLEPDERPGATPKPT